MTACRSSQRGRDLVAHAVAFLESSAKDPMQIAIVRSFLVRHFAQPSKRARLVMEVPELLQETGCPRSNLPTHIREIERGIWQLGPFLAEGVVTVNIQGDRIFFRIGKSFLEIQAPWRNPAMQGRSAGAGASSGLQP